MAGGAYQLLFRNATIVDGSGGPVREGDVAVRDGAIALVGGHVGGRADEEVDARDLVLAPGFIDPHTHLDANLFWDADVTPSSSFGVTTVVTTNCGYGLAPVLRRGGPPLPGGRHEYRRADPGGLFRERRAVRLVRPRLLRGPARPARRADQSRLLDRPRAACAPPCSGCPRRTPGAPARPR